MDLAKDWRRGFSSRVLERAELLFESGAVVELAAVGGTCEAIVRGTKDYRVSLEGAKVSRATATCTCPHYADGHLCKHIAAVCMRIESSEEAPEPAPRGKRVESLGEIAGRLDAETLRAFVLDELGRDDRMARRFRMRFGKRDEKASVAEFKKAITQLKSAYARRGFIEWNEALDFEIEMRDLIESAVAPCLERGAYRAAVDLVFALLVKLQTIYIDDSHGFFTEMMSEVRGYLSEVRRLAPPEVVADMVERLASFVRKNPGRDEGDIYWFERETAEDVLREEFASDKRFCELIMTLADERIAAIEEDALRLSYGAYSLRLAADWVVARLQAMAAAGMTTTERERYAEEWMEFTPVRQVFVDEALAVGDTSRAIRLLEEGMGEGPCPDQLLELYEREGDVEALKGGLRRNLLAYNGYDVEGARALYRRLLGLYDAEEREVVRDELLSSLERSRMRQACLAEAGMLEELRASIDQEQYGKLDVALSFANELADVYPAWLLGLYADEVREAAGCASSRKHYRAVVERMRGMAAIEGGEEAMRTLADELRTCYPRRPAFQDELSKL